MLQFTSLLSRLIIYEVKTEDWKRKSILCGPFLQRITEDSEKASLHDAVTITWHPISYKTISLCWITVKFLVCIHAWPTKLTLIKLQTCSNDGAYCSFCSMLRCHSEVYLFTLWILIFVALLFHPIGRVSVNSFWSYGQKHVLWEPSDLDLWPPNSNQFIRQLCQNFNKKFSHTK